MKEYLQKNKHNIIVAIIVIIPVTAFYLTLGCPIRFFTGISCPGCGMSRALMAFLMLDFQKAFEMHPLIFIMPFVAVIYIFRKFLPKRLRSVLLVLFFISMLTVYLYRMFSGSNIVYFEPQSGAIFKLFSFISGGI